MVVTVLAAAVLLVAAASFWPGVFGLAKPSSEEAKLEEPVGEYSLVCLRVAAES